MTKIPAKNQKKTKNTLKTLKMTKIPLKPKNYQNNHETYKMTKIPLKPKNDQNILETKKQPGVFWSFYGLQGYFDHFLGFGGILVIFRF